jgi:hypothetical protein
MTNEVEFQTVNFAEEHQITIIYKHYCPGIEWCDVDLALCSSGREACEKV